MSAQTQRLAPLRQKFKNLINNGHVGTERRPVAGGNKI